jgi:hypothetical protein
MRRSRARAICGTRRRDIRRGLLNEPFAGLASPSACPWLRTRVRRVIDWRRRDFELAQSMCDNAILSVDQDPMVGGCCGQGDVWTGERAIEDGHAAVHRTIFVTASNASTLES